MRLSAGINPQRRKVRNGGTLDSDRLAQRRYSRAFVMLGLGHSASKPKGSFVRYTGCLPRVSTP